MRLIFLADATFNLGTGHVMRSLALAETAASLGIESFIVGKLDKIDWIIDRIRRLNVGHIDEISCLPKSKSEFDILIIDSYDDFDYSSLLNFKKWALTVNIADPNTPVRNLDLVLHPGFTSEWYKGSKNNFYYGPNYIPLRKDIQKITRTNLSDNLDKVIIFAGGIDTFQFSFEFAKILSKITFFKKATFFSSTDTIISRLDRRFEILPFGSNLDKEIMSADLIVTTASTSALESIAREVPTAIACAVENQEENYSSLEKLNLALSIGKREASGEWLFDNAKIRMLFSDREFRKNLIKSQSGVIDLKGGERIINLFLTALKKIDS